MKKIYINSVIVWNSFWSHGHELTKTLSRKNKVYYFENIRIRANIHSGLREMNEYPMPKNIEIIRSPKTFKRVGLFYLIANQLFSLNSLWKKRKDVDFFLSYNTYDLLALTLAKILRKKTVFLFIDEYDILTTRPKLIPLLKFLLKRHLKYSDKIICTAKKLYQQAKKYNKNVYYLPNAVNLENLNIITSLEIKPKSGLKIGFIGHLGSWIDIDLIIKTAKKYPKINFEIIGDGKLMPDFIEAQKKLKNIKLTGEVSHPETYKYSVNFDLALIPFIVNKITQSVSPIKLFEYWLVKKPVLARKTIELEQFSDSLLLYENEEQFFEHLDKFIKNPGTYKELGNKGFALVQNQYNWQKYNEIINKEILI